MFVIQEYYVCWLYYDFWLECDGVLVLWVVLKNLFDNILVNYLVIYIEDYLLEYVMFEGVIFSGEYGVGKVIIWDFGIYDIEKFYDDLYMGEVIVNLYGGWIFGCYVLIWINGDWWLVYCLKNQKDQKVFEFDNLVLMFVMYGMVVGLKVSQWVFEGKWDGYWLLVEVDYGVVWLWFCSGCDVIVEYL